METCIKRQEIQNIKSSIFILNMEKHSSRQGGQCVPSSIIVNCIQKNKVDEQCHPSWPLALKLFPPFQNIYTCKSYVSSFSRNSRTKSQSSLSVALNLHNWKSNQFGKKNISLTKVHVWTLYIIRWQHFCTSLVLENGDAIAAFLTYLQPSNMHELNFFWSHYHYRNKGRNPLLFIRATIIYSI